MGVCSLKRSLYFGEIQFAAQVANGTGLPAEVLAIALYLVGEKMGLQCKALSGMQSCKVVAGQPGMD